MYGNLMAASGGRGRRATTLGKFFGYYSIVAVSLVWIADSFVGWSYIHLFTLLALVILPSFVSGFLVYESRQKDGRMRTWLFLAAAEFHLVWVTLVIVYEVFELDDIAQSTLKAAAALVVVTALAIGVAVYRNVKALMRRDAPGWDFGG